MKITRAYLARAVLWATSVCVAGALMFALVSVVAGLILLVADVGTVLYWVLVSVFGFIFLVLVYVGSDLAVEVMRRWNHKA